MKRIECIRANPAGKEPPTPEPTRKTLSESEILKNRAEKLLNEVTALKEEMVKLEKRRKSLAICHTEFLRKYEEWKKEFQKGK